MSKQSISFLNTQTFIRKYPIILFFQHNNLSVKQWFMLRVELKKLGNINLLLFKNSVIENVLIQENFSQKKYSKSLFQGPCFAIGFSNFPQFNNILKLTTQSSKIFFIGGIMNQQFINHLDISKILKLDNQIYELFLISLNKSTQLHNKIIKPLQNSYFHFNQLSLNLIECLEFLKLNK